jgi:hypothetical protein
VREEAQLSGLASDEQVEIGVSIPLQMKVAYSLKR